MSYLVLGVIETVHPFNLINYRKSIFKSNPFQSKVMNLAVLITIVIVVLSIAIPFTAFQTALGITTLSLRQWALGIGAGMMIIPLIELYKIFKRKYYKNKENNVVLDIGLTK